MKETPLALSRKAAEALAERGVPNPRHDAEALLAHVLGIRRLDLYLQYDRPLTGAEVERYRAVVRRRRKREPLQYIIGEVGFRDLVLNVDRRVLIPRPETELLVGAVLDGVAARRASSARVDSAENGSGGGMVALDVGTGSGVIAISLAREGPFDRIVATDVSAAALELMMGNARRAGVSDRIEPRHGSLWEPLERGERFDVIVSNPPYVPEADRQGLPPEVRDWEPAEALFAAGGGMAAMNRLIEDAPDHLRPGGLLAFEVGLSQARDAAARLETTGAYGRVEVVEDLTGRERVVWAETDGGAS